MANNEMKELTPDDKKTMSEANIRQYNAVRENMILQEKRNKKSKFSVDTGFTV